ncbi:MAG: LptF/LptG family permease [Victivallaceae bacterium]|nr:LptF/LptG family permease [Victivallaceae bacterium]
MKILNIYVTRAFIGTFCMALGILTFGMMGARLVKIFDLLSQGMPLGSVLLFIVYSMPIVLSFTIPWAVLVSVMLLFGRLSADSEITAMRACGISILQIISPILIITFIMTVACFYIQTMVGPHYLGQARTNIKNSAISHPMAIFEPGRPMSFENNIVYIEDRVGENKIKGVQIFTMNSAGTRALQDITAPKGEIIVDKALQQLKIVLYDCNIIDKSAAPTSRLFNKKVEFVVDYGKEFNRKRISTKPKYMTLNELLSRIRIDKKLNRKTLSLEIELNQRIAMSLAPIAFLLLGLPLAIRTSRRETSINLFLSIIMGGIFYLAVIICSSMDSQPQLYPQYLLWLPNIIYQIIGTVLIIKITRR